ncbi:hypothetical protein P9112_004932 [Eukaryota sp. TZLM1-RC]
MPALTTVLSLSISTLVILILKRYFTYYRFQIISGSNKLHDIVANSDIYRNQIRPPIHCVSGTLHTLHGSKTKAPALAWKRFYVKDEEDDVFAIDELLDTPPPIKSNYTLPSSLAPLRSNAPVLLLLHSMGGSARERPVRRMAYQARMQGFRCFCLIVRGCGNTKLNKPNFRGLAGVDYRDLDCAVKYLKKQYQTNLYVCGFSLGSMLLLNFLTRSKEATSDLIAGAVAAYTTFDASIGLRLSPKQQTFFGKLLIPFIKNNYDVLKQIKEIKVDKVLQEKTLISFDANITAPAIGFDSPSSYYNALSQGTFEYLHRVSVPLLLYVTQDDPVTGPHCPDVKAHISDNIVLVKASEGGHLGSVVRNSNQDVFSSLAVDFMSELL